MPPPWAPKLEGVCNPVHTFSSLILSDYSAKNNVFSQTLPPNFPHTFHNHANQFHDYPNRSRRPCRAIYR